MPNTGRFYAPSPAAAATYRERYMRPYAATVSPPLGGVSHTANTAAVPSPKAPPSAAYSRLAAPLRHHVMGNNEVGAPYTTTSSPYESRIRSRPTPPSYEDERRPWTTTTTTHTDRQVARPRGWSEEEDEVSVHRGAPLSSIGTLRSTEMNNTSRQQRIQSSANYDAVMGIPSRESFESTSLPSALPRLSSLLKRSATEVGQYESEDPFLTRKRAREASPPKNDSEHQATAGRPFYEQDAVFADRHVLAKVGDGVWGGEPPRVHELPAMRRDMTMQLMNPRSYVNIAQPSVAANTHNHQQSFAGLSRYPYVREEVHMTASTSNHPQRSTKSTTHHEPPAVRQEYDEPVRVYDVRSRNHFALDNQPNASSPVGLNSPLPTAIARDHLSPIRRYSETKGSTDCVIEAAADLVEERSPSKRESITKLLLKSKEFLKAKSLVRNRNNEIDWVATFLNVGFEPNSIYSLMCPLRKGRWKVEEENYTIGLLRLIESGVIRLRHGQSIRGFVAKKLHSDDMRVLKKLSNCKMFHFARLINPHMSDGKEIDDSIPNVRVSLDRLDKLKAEFLRSVQLEALVAVRKYLSDTSIRDLLNARD